LIAGNSLAYWQNQQQRQAEKEPVFIEIICEDWYEFKIDPHKYVVVKIETLFVLGRLPQDKTTLKGG
jgi:hypothetical protein